MPVLPIISPILHKIGASLNHYFILVNDAFKTPFSHEVLSQAILTQEVCANEVLSQENSWQGRSLVIRESQMLKVQAVERLKIEFRSVIIP